MKLGSLYLAYAKKQKTTSFTYYFSLILVKSKGKFSTTQATTYDTFQNSTSIRYRF